MSNQLAIILGVAILAAVGIDYFLAGGETLLFLGRKFFVLLDWVAFWR
ncbi:hypothetical protein J7443_06570 [Tropicibacter sp. R15_0]|nr:hypothetical protein [Tropicibacter sp. R15_0]MBO9464883.1 hypothetical protein [Tropicibacter sp. R15_0]